MNFGEKEFSTFCDLRDRWNDIQYSAWKTEEEKQVEELKFAREIKAFPFHVSYRFFIFLGEGGYWGYGDPSLDRIGELFAIIEHEEFS